MSKAEFDKAVAEIKEAMGGHFVGEVGDAAAGQLGLATDEPDKGPDIRGEWCDKIEATLRAHSLRIPFMPFPVSGRLVYVFAGLNRLAA